jgi:RNA polymerase sigma-70 factor, ECF subfamily
MSSPHPERDEPDPARSGHRTPLSLLEKARANDGEAWRKLWKLYCPLVLYWCRRSVSAQDAEDVSQEVFSNAFRKIKEFRRGQPGDSFRGWLRTITRNSILLHSRRDGKHPQAAGGDEALQSLKEVADPLADCQQEEEEVVFSQVVRQITELVRSEFNEKTWQAFWLYGVEKRPPATLVEELGMSVAAIRQAKSRVLHRLKQEAGELME